MGKGQSRHNPVNSFRPITFWRPPPPPPPPPPSPYNQTPSYFAGISQTGADVSNIQDNIFEKAKEYVSQVNSVQSTVQTNDRQIQQLYSDAKNDQNTLTQYQDAYGYVQQYIDTLSNIAQKSSKLLSDINSVQYTVQNTDYGQIQNALNDARQRSIDAAGAQDAGASSTASSTADADSTTAKTLLNDIVNKINQISGFSGQSNQLLSDAQLAGAQVKSIAYTPATFSDSETLTQCYDKNSSCTLGSSIVTGEKYVKEVNSNWPSSGNKYNNIAKACDYSCPCVYGTTFIPDDTCSRTCGEPGLLTGHYALVSGPNTCSAKCGTPGFIGDCTDPAKQTTRIPCNNNPVMPCPTPSTLGGFYPDTIMESFTGNVDLSKVGYPYNKGKPVPDNIDTILDNNEANLLQALYEFNNEYYYYVNQCNNKPGNTVPTGPNNPVNPATNLPLNCDDILYQIKQDGNMLNYYIGQTANIPDPASLVEKTIAIQTNNNYNNTRGNIISTYNDIVQERSDLDSKLKELYDLPGSSISLDYRYNYEATIYSGILLTVLASGLIYYTFTKLDS